MNDWPAVSYVMPVLNEAADIEAALDSILEQKYPGDWELVLGLGPSVDATNDIVARRVGTDPRIRTVEVPERIIAASLNRAIRAARFPVLARVDAHVELPPRYTERAVDTLRRVGAATVGGIMVAVGRPGVQPAVAAAYNSRWGLGGGAYHHEDEPPGPAESAYLGVMDRTAIEEIGGYDETVGRGEDWELNHRLRTTGHVVWLDPALRVAYRPRTSWSSLRRQFWATGVWRAELVRRLGRKNSLRYFAPPTLVAGTGATAVCLALAVGGVGGAATTALAVAGGAGLAGYGVLVLVVGARSGGSARARLRMSGVLATMHYAWGSGFLYGLVQGAEGTLDTSRARPDEQSEVSP